MRPPAGFARPKPCAIFSRGISVANPEAIEAKTLETFASPTSAVTISVSPTGVDTKTAVSKRDKSTRSQYTSAMSLCSRLRAYVTTGTLQLEMISEAKSSSKFTTTR